MKRFNVLHALAVLFVFSQIVWGAVPQLINFQGILKDGSGNPVPDASYSVTFTIYDAATGGNNLWTETQSVSTTDGLFAVLLGSSNPVPDTAFKGSDRWLGIAVSPDGEMPARQRLVSVGYAYRVNSVDSASGGTITSKVSIGPGHTNTGANSFVAGENNIVNGDYATVGGGFGNVANGIYATVPGGRLCNAAGDHSLAAGYLANALHHSAFVWADGAAIPFNSTGINQFLIRASGGVGIGTASPQAALHVIGDFKVSGNIIGSQPWTSLGFLPGYNNYNDVHGGGFQTVQYRKIGDIVYLRGMIHRFDHTGIPNGALLGLLPPPFRPPAIVRFTTDPGVSAIDIHPTGNVISLGSSQEYQFLDGISFSTSP